MVGLIDEEDNYNELLTKKSKYIIKLILWYMPRMRQIYLCWLWMAVWWLWLRTLLRPPYWIFFQPYLFASIECKIIFCKK